MNRFRKHPVSIACLGVLMLVILAEVALVGRARGQVRETRLRLAGLQSEFDALQRSRPAPTPANASLIEADLARVPPTLAALRAIFQSRQAGALLVALPPPATRTDAFFDLSLFVEQTRTRADAARVAVKPGGRFGFGVYANEGPSEAAIGPVFRQRLILESLLALLFAAAPRDLVQVQRQRITDFGAADPDCFTIDPRLSAFQAGLIETQAFRLAFTGQTAVLRRFLNALAESEMGFVICCVEIEPAGEYVGPLLAGTLSAADGWSVPSAASVPGKVALIAENLSRFTVTVEFVQLAAPAPAQGGETAVR